MTHYEWFSMLIYQLLQDSSFQNKSKYLKSAVKSFRKTLVLFGINLSYCLSQCFHATGICKRILCICCFSLRLHFLFLLVLRQVRHVFAHFLSICTHGLVRSSLFVGGTPRTSCLHRMSSFSCSK